MINEKMQDAMNEQIKNEMYSSYLYLSMAAYFHNMGLDGMGHWMRMQAMEENMHAMKLFDHINDRDGRIHLLAIDQPPCEWASPLEAWKAAYKHEQLVTSLINNLVKLANEVSDYAAVPLLNWFIEEQIEEEATAAKIVQTLERLGSSGEGLIMLDKELSARTFNQQQADQKGE